LDGRRGAVGSLWCGSSYRIKNRLKAIERDNDVA
jgi:hypothetical protein